MATLVEIGLWNTATAAVLALLAAAVARLCRRPALTHILWALVLLKLVTPPLVPFSLPWPREEASDPPVAEERPAAPVDEPVPAPVADLDVPPVEIPDDGEAIAPNLPEPPAPPTGPAVPFPWRWWAGVIWLAGSALWVGWAAYHVVCFRRVLRRARLAPGPLRTEVEALAQRLGLRRCPNVWLLPGAVSPMVWALGGRPCLLFPAGLLEQLDEAGRAALLAHELAHVRRRDHWLRLLELAATGLYWWNPVLWWARRELHEAEEQCCDAWGVWALGGDGRPYALALLQAVAFVSQARLPLPAGASGSVGQVSHLKRRLAMIMKGQTSRSLSWVGFAGVLGLGLLLLPLFPAVGQDKADPTRRPDVAPTTPPAVDPRSNRDAEIERLKRALDKLIEDDKAAEGGRKDEKAAETQLLKAQLADLEKTIVTKRAELSDLQAKANMLRAKLAEMEIRRERGRVVTTPPAVKPRPIQVEDLEKKLDLLQKELEELRRELKQGPAGSPDRPRLRERGGVGGPLPPPVEVRPPADPATGRPRAGGPLPPPVEATPPVDPARR